MCPFPHRVKFPSGGFAHLRCLVFSGYPDAIYHITTGKVSFYSLPRFLCRSRRFQKAYRNKRVLWAA